MRTREGRLQPGGRLTAASPTWRPGPPSPLGGHTGLPETCPKPVGLPWTQSERCWEGNPVGKCGQQSGAVDPRTERWGLAPVWILCQRRAAVPRRKVCVGQGRAGQDLVITCPISQVWVLYPETSILGWGRVVSEGFSGWHLQSRPCHRPAWPNEAFRGWCWSISTKRWEREQVSCCCGVCSMQAGHRTPSFHLQ